MHIQRTATKSNFLYLKHSRKNYVLYIYFHGEYNVFRVNLFKCCEMERRFWHWQREFKFVWKEVFTVSETRSFAQTSTFLSVFYSRFSISYLRNFDVNFNGFVLREWATMSVKWSEVHFSFQYSVARVVRGNEKEIRNYVKLG